MKPVCLLGWILPLTALAEPAHQRVLLIHSFSRDFAPFSSVASGFRAELARNATQKIEFVEVSLQTLQSGDDQQAAILADFVGASFSDRPPDLVTAIGLPAAQFYLSMVSGNFHSTPLLIAGADARRLGELTKDPRIVSASLELDLALLLADMRRVRPGLKRVYYITGVTPVEAFWEAQVLDAWNTGEVSAVSLSHLPFAEALQFVHDLPPDSAVFIGIVDRDAAGVTFEANAALLELHEVSAAPIFGMAAQQLGRGIVGGHLIDVELAGRHAAQAAIKILDGVPPSEIHIEPTRPGTPAYDARELQRWRVPEKALPPGSVIHFRRPTLWQAHRKTALATGGIIAAQAFLIFLLISARKRARQMHDHLDLAAEAAGAGFCNMDLNNDFIRTSKQWNKLFGFDDVSQVSFEQTLARVHPDDRDALQLAIGTAAREKTPYLVEHRVILPDGQQKWIASLGRADVHTQEDSRHIRGVSIDITSRKSNEAEITRQRDALFHLSRVGTLGLISGSLAHELNQPLGVILSNAQAAERMLARENPNLTELRAILADIAAEDRRANEVIRGWRTLLRQGQSECIPVELRSNLDEIIKLTHSELNACAISLRIDFPEADLPYVMVDPVQLQQVFLNLILNARDASMDVSRDRKKIEMCAWREANTVRFVIRDHGIGLPTERHILFEPFRTTKENGLGMGLAICQTILAHHGGRLWAVEPDGPGAEFHLSLPIELLTP
jgi:PAS domain S-box-containing protein